MDADTAKGVVIRRRVLRNTLSNYVGKTIALGLGFLLTPFILHHLGTTGYGLWMLVGAFVGYGSLLDLGIADAVIKYVAQYRATGEMDRAHGLVATALRLYVALGAVAVILSAAIAPVFPDLFRVPHNQHATAAWLMLLMGISLGISIPSAITTSVLRGLQRFDIVNLLSVVGSLVYTGITVVILLLGGGVVDIVAVGIPVSLLMQAPSIVAIHRVAPDLRFGWSGARGAYVRQVVSYSTSLFVIHAAGRLQTKTDEILIAVFLPVGRVTPYAITRRFGDVAQILTDQFMRVLVPVTSELHAQDDGTRVRSVYIVGSRLALAIFLSMGISMAVLAQPFLTAWIGAGYGQYWNLAVILLLASFIETSQWPAIAVLQGIGRHQPLAAMWIGAGIANLLLSVLLIHPLGLEGVALGTLVPTTLASLGLVLPYALRVVDVPPKRALREVFLPSLAPVLPTALVVYAARQAFMPTSLLAVIAIAAIGPLVYGIGYLCMTANQLEREVFWSLVLGAIRFARTRAKGA